MSKRIEEEFRAIAPSGRRAVPGPSVIGIGLSIGDLGTSLSQAAEDVAQLRVRYQEQSDLIAANPQVARGSVSTSSGSTIGEAARSVFGGTLGLLSPAVKGILGLFGGGVGTPPPALPVYTPPPSIAIDGILRAQANAAAPAGQAVRQADKQLTDFAFGAPAPVRQPEGQVPGAAGDAAAQNFSPQITVNISAMDSQSFMDRSADIASAVREAMLNLHPINAVIAGL